MANVKLKAKSNFFVTIDGKSKFIKAGESFEVPESLGKHLYGLNKRVEHTDALDEKFLNIKKVRAVRKK